MSLIFPLCGWALRHRSETFCETLGNVECCPSRWQEPLSGSHLGWTQRGLGPSLCKMGHRTGLSYKNLKQAVPKAWNVGLELFTGKCWAVWGMANMLIK